MEERIEEVQEHHTFDCLWDKGAGLGLEVELVGAVKGLWHDRLASAGRMGMKEVYQVGRDYSFVGPKL